MQAKIEAILEREHAAALAWRAQPAA